MGQLQAELDALKQDNAKPKAQTAGQEQWSEFIEVILGFV